MYVFKESSKDSKLDISRFLSFNLRLQSEREYFFHPDAWQEYAGSAYYFSSHVTDRDSAQRCCQREGAHLTSITSAQELTFIMDQ